MDLYVIRHAEAADKETWSGDDAARPLTPRGEKRFSAMVRWLGDRDVRIHRLLHSPWLRAVQTADLAAPLLADDAVTEVTPHLAEPPSGALLAHLVHAGPARGSAAQVADAGTVAVVGHEPWLSELVAWLVTGDRGARFVLDKGAVAVLSGDPVPRGMALVALYPGKTPREAART